MQQELLIAILAGLGGMLGWGFADFFAKKTIDKVGPIVSLVWAHLFGTLILSLIAIYQVFIIKQPIGIPGDIKTWGMLIFFGTLQAIVYLLVYQGFGKGQLAVLNPVFASYSGIAAFLSIMILGEVSSAYRVLALVVIFCGILLLSIDVKGLLIKRLNSVPGLMEIGIAAILAASWTLLWDKFVGGRDWLSYALFMYAFMTIAAFIISKAQKINLSIVKPGLWKFLILIGLGETIAYLTISLGFSTTSLTSIVALISGSFSLPTIILARIFLKEKTTAAQTFGSIVVIAGIILLSINNL